jgi:hypothetical protein
MIMVDIEKEVASLRAEISDLRDFVKILYGMMADSDEDMVAVPVRSNT